MTRQQLTLIEGGAGAQAQPPIPAPPRARATDPYTSHLAAQRARKNRDSMRSVILDTFASFGPMSDDALVGMMPGHYLGASIKTARSALTKEGFLVATGETRMSNAGSPMNVWRIATSDEQESAARDRLAARGVDVGEGA